MGTLMAMKAWFASIEAGSKAVLILFALGLLLVIGFTGFHLIRSVEELAQDKGAATAAGAAATKGLKHVENANKAAVAVDRDDAVRRDGCLRYSRTPEHC